MQKWDDQDKQLEMGMPCLILFFVLFFLNSLYQNINTKNIIQNTNKIYLDYMLIYNQFDEYYQINYSSIAYFQIFLLILLLLSLFYVIIFVIFTKAFLLEQKMMFDSNFDSLDENRILSELSRLDSRLASKKNIIATDTSRITKQRFSSFSKPADHYQCQPLFPPLPNNFEYFSQINNKEVEDSLFDQSMHTIEENEKSKEPNSYTLNSCALKDSKISKNCDKKSKSILQNTSSRGMILKEQEYIFKKQSNQNNPSFKKNINKNTNNSKSQASIPKNNKQKQARQVQGKYKANLHHYLNCDYSSNDVQYEQIRNDKIKTQQCTNSYQNIEDYLLRLSSSQLAQRNQDNSKSSSRIKCKNSSILEGKQKSLQCTFKPKILQKSKQLAKNGKNVIERLTNFDKQKVQKMPYQPVKQNNPKPSYQRIDQLSQPRKIKIADPSDVQQLPSFKPNLSKKSLEHMSNCTYDVATRNKLWLQQKQEKIQKMRQEEEQERKRKQQMSHSPSIKIYKGQPDVQFSKFGKEGMVNYFQRLSLLKKRPSKSNLNKNDTYNSRFPDESHHNKENQTHNFSKQRSFTNLPNKQKNQTYSQAVKNLHSKIMNLKI